MKKLTEHITKYDIEYDNFEYLVHDISQILVGYSELQERQIEKSSKNSTKVGWVAILIAFASFILSIFNFIT